MTAKPLLCTRCGAQVGIAEDVTGHCDWGLAVIDEQGTVRPAQRHMEFHKGDPVRVRAVCGNPDCRHQWTLRRQFDPTEPIPEPASASLAKPTARDWDETPAEAARYDRMHWNGGENE